MTAKAATKGWLAKALELEAGCDISAGPVLPRVKVSSGSGTSNDHAHHGHARKATTTYRTTRRVLAKV